LLRSREVIRPLSDVEHHSVIFGGSGFIGTHLTAYLLAEGWRVTVVDLVPVPEGPHVQFRFADVRRPVDLNLGGQVDLIFNLAAVHRTPGHPDSQYYETNVLGAIHVTRWATEVQAPAMVFTSSISVYGAGEDLKVEQTALAPNSAYGRSKRMAEEIHRSWLAGSPDMARKLVICRPAAVFGPGENGNFARLAQALQRGAFWLPGRTDTLKAAGYVKELGASLMFALSKGPPEVTVNFGMPVVHRIDEICEAFREVAGYKSPRVIPDRLVRLGLSTLSPLEKAGVDAGLLARVQKVRASTNVAPQQLVDLGYSWRFDLRSSLKDWYESWPVGSFV
jgi:nucleoside-diphosphate-sugar epimerase